MRAGYNALLSPMTQRSERCGRYAVAIFSTAPFLTLELMGHTMQLHTMDWTSTALPRSSPAPPPTRLHERDAVHGARPVLSGAPADSGSSCKR